MRNKTILLPIILMILSANSLAQTPSAAEFVRSFYKFHREKDGFGFWPGEVKMHKKWFSAHLNRLFQVALNHDQEFLKEHPTEKPRFGDGFPFFPSESFCPGSSNVLKIGSKSFQKGKTVVEMKFYQPQTCGGALMEVSKAELIRDKGVWRINDWIYDNGGRLSELLKMK